MMGTRRICGLVVWCASLVALLGCGGKGTGSSADGAAPVQLSGTIGGRTFVVRDAVIATTVSWKSSLYPGESTLIILADNTALCDQIQTDVTKVNTQLLILDLAEAGAGTAQPITSAGTFPISADLPCLAPPSPPTRTPIPSAASLISARRRVPSC